MSRRAGRGDGGLAARRAVVRWSWRLFRREWRQQLLAALLVTVAVAITVAGASAAYNTATSGDARFGTATHRLEIDAADPGELAVELDSIEAWFGTVDPIATWNVALPGSSQDVEVRSQDPDGPFGSSIVALRSGRYPRAEDEIALTEQVADELGATDGAAVELDGRDWTMVGTVENPHDLDEEFALVSPTLDRAPDTVAVLVDTTNDQIRARPDSGSTAGAFVDERGTDERSTAALGVYLVATVVLLLVALVAAAAFVVMAHRRQRQIGLLAATGAGEAHLRLVMLADGAAVGAVAAVAGTVLGLLLWLAIAPVVEPAAGHRIDRLDVPWWVIATGMVLAVVTATGASWWPARSVARMPVTDALSARPPAPRPARRSAVLAGTLLAAGAAAIAWSDPNRVTEDPQPMRDVATVGGVVAITAGVLFVCPSALVGAARLARRLPVAGRLAVRDLARYQARAGIALGAVSLALGIPIATVIAADAAQAGPDPGNLAADELLVRIGEAEGSFVADTSPDELVALQDAVDRLGDQVEASDVIALDMALEPGTRALPGFDDLAAVGVGYRVDEDSYRDVPAYVATPELLAHLGVAPDSLAPDLDLLTVREEGEELWLLSSVKRRMAPELLTEREPLDVTPYSSAPTTLLTPAALERRGWDTAPAGWLVVGDEAFTGDQVRAAREVAAAAGLRVESRQSDGQQTLRLGAVGLGSLAALAVVAMTVGLVRAEAAGDLRTLTATGATSTVRRRLTAWTAGTLGLLGVALGGLGAYLALASGYVHDLAALGDVPILELSVLAAGVPLLAAGAGWALGGREPASLVRREA